MAEIVTIPAAASDTVSATGGKKNKEEKKDLTLDKLELSLYRAQLAMIRTATTTTSLGFALYKLIEEKTHDGTSGPLIHYITPRMVALVLFFTGFLGLLSYSFRHVKTLKKINRLKPKFFISGVMLMSYVILLLTFLLLIAALIRK